MNEQKVVNQFVSSLPNNNDDNNVVALLIVGIFGIEICRRSREPQYYCIRYGPFSPIVKARVSIQQCSAVLMLLKQSEKREWSQQQKIPSYNTHTLIFHLIKTVNKTSFFPLLRSSSEFLPFCLSTRVVSQCQSQLFSSFLALPPSFSSSLNEFSRSCSQKLFTAIKKW